MPTGDLGCVGGGRGNAASGRADPIGHLAQFPCESRSTSNCSNPVAKWIYTKGVIPGKGQNEDEWKSGHRRTSVVFAREVKTAQKTILDRRPKQPLEAQSEWEGVIERKIA
jgi:hypothetical protein